ncbi:hypothetical protein ACOWKN_06195 [Helicobacter pylori]
MLKAIYRRLYRLVSRNKRIENARKLIEEYTEAVPCEDSADELSRQYSNQKRARSLKEELHDLKFDNWVERFGSSLAELCMLIKQEQATLKKLSTSIQQEGKQLQQKRENVDLQMEWLDILSQSNIEINAKKPVKPIEILPPKKVIPFEQKENLQTNKPLQA